MKYLILSVLIALVCSADKQPVAASAQPPTSDAKQHPAAEAKPSADAQPADTPRTSQKSTIDAVLAQALDQVLNSNEDAIAAVKTALQASIGSTAVRDVEPSKLNSFYNCEYKMFVNDECNTAFTSILNADQGEPAKDLKQNFTEVTKLFNQLKQKVKAADMKETAVQTAGSDLLQGQTVDAAQAQNFQNFWAEITEEKSHSEIQLGEFNKYFAIKKDGLETAKKFVKDAAADTITALTDLRAAFDKQPETELDDKDAEVQLTNYSEIQLNAFIDAIKKGVKKDEKPEETKGTEEKKAGTEEKKAGTEEKKAGTEEKKAGTEEKKETKVEATPEGLSDACDAHFGEKPQNLTVNILKVVKIEKFKDFSQDPKVTGFKDIVNAAKKIITTDAIVKAVNTSLQKEAQESKTTLIEYCRTFFGLENKKYITAEDVNGKLTQDKTKEFKENDAVNGCKDIVSAVVFYEKVLQGEGAKPPMSIGAIVAIVGACVVVVGIIAYCACFKNGEDE